MYYYVQKTGMEMFDVCRLYGLALLIDIYAQMKNYDNRIILEDKGYYYCIQGPEAKDINEQELKNNKNYLSLFTPSDNWSKIFLTITLSPTIDTKNEKRKNKILSIINNKTKIIQSEISSNIQMIYKNYSNGSYLPEITSKKKDGFDTIYQSIDVSASKGFRRPIRDGYEDGGQVYAPLSDLALAYVGGAHFIQWIWGDSIIGVLPSPIRASYKNYMEIQSQLKDHNICRVSVNTALAHYAINLVECMRKQSVNQSYYADKYSFLVYSAMIKTGNQWKPSSGGIFPLDNLFSMIENDVNTAGGIFDIWNNIFRNARDGREDLGISLAEFISYPLLDNYYDYINIHLKYSLNKDLQKKKIFLPKYSSKEINLVMKYVN
ncbi:MAG: hypothetical protein QMC99_08190 [Methanocella conradii]|nr:hypothetical protein [Methanocella conradii]